MASISTANTYTAGDTVILDLGLAHVGQVRWGFEITALDATLEPAGVLVVSDPAHTQGASDARSGRNYMLHTSAGTYNGTADASPGWSVKWVQTAAGTGPVTFYMVGLAANGGGTGGDFTYTTSRTIEESLVTDVDDDGGTGRPTDFRLAGNYPNPFNPGTTVEYYLPRGASVDLSIFNLLGQQVRTLKVGFETAGSHSLSWNGTDDRGRAVAGGVYFVRLTTDEVSITRKMLLLK